MVSLCGCAGAPLCRYRWHCYDMKIDAAKGPKPVELSLDDGYTMQGDQHKLLPPAPSAPKPAKTKETQAAQAAAAAASACTPVPHNGKITATFGRTRAEALLDLPAPGRLHADVYGGGGAVGDGPGMSRGGGADEAEAAETMKAMATAMWVTVGLLARDGFALQVKLKKTKGVHEAYRCGKTGLYYVYEPAGGAITVARK